MSSKHFSECQSNPNKFCVVCGSFVKPKKLRKVTSKMKDAYVSAFNREFPAKGRFVPEFMCTTCSANLYKWYKGKLPALSLIKPAKWVRAAKLEDCLFCPTKPNSRIIVGARRPLYPETSPSKRAKKVNRVRERKKKPQWRTQKARRIW